MTICILLNIVFLFLRLELESRKVAIEFGVGEVTESPNLDKFCVAMQHFFCWVFLLELVVRVSLLRWRFFYTTKLELFNIFDACIVASAIIELYVIASFASDLGIDLTVVRGFRCIRALRISRAFEGISRLRLLLATVIASFCSLFWSMLLLFLTMLMASLIMNQLVVYSLQAQPFDDDVMEWVYRYYGTPGRSLWSFFELTFSGGWPNYARRLVEEVSVFFAVFWSVYVSCIIFAMTRIISALFLKDTLQAAADDSEKQTQKKLANVFSAADTSGDGTISMQEFEHILKQSQVKSYLEKLGLEADNPEQLFKLLDDGDGSLSHEEFLKHAAKMKGGAKSQDMKAMLQEMKAMKQELNQATHKPLQRVNSLPTYISRSRSRLQ